MTYPQQPDGLFDLLSNVEDLAGLVAFSSPEGRFCVHIAGGTVQAVFIDGRPLRSEAEARATLLRQLSPQVTGCQFEDALPEDLRKGFHIPLADLLAEAPEPPKGFFQKILGRFAHA